ncbi:MAG TPA: DUF1826 domain-containing protein [Sandaracinaceae bacterium LLY-WYZ-13_1]|nr:DUF1826 domain-containing protein [Sandaracinaceae bacterium LLY-WYZ-13_1]
MEELEPTAAVHADSNAGAVVRASELADLTRLYDPDVMLVIAPAPASSGALLHAATLVDAGVRRSRVEVDTPGGVPIPGVLDRLAVHDGDHAEAWTAYLEEVTTVFAYLVDARSVGVRMVVSDAPHCPRFHVDRVVARAVLTVVGSGTEWLTDEHLDRSRLGHAGGADDATSGLVREWWRIERADAGGLAVFKGTAWPGAAERAIVHRSPPADGLRRIVLTLDWLD